MESAAIKKLEKEFQHRLLDVCSDFDKSPKPFKSRDVLFRRELPNEVAAFLLLAISPREDRFTLEVAWSHDGHFPADMLCRLAFGNPATGDPPDRPVNGQIRFRISEFWSPGRDDWWYLSGSKPDLRTSIAMSGFG